MAIIGMCRIFFLIQTLSAVSDKVMFVKTSCNSHFWVGYWLTLAQYSMTFKVYIMHNDSSK